MNIQSNRHIPFFADLIVTRPKGDLQNEGRLLAEADAFERTKETPLILCRNCYYTITKPQERIEIDTAHRHTFANPNGHVFEIGCFRNADGCAVTGIKTNEFTWFPGYTWQIGVCRRCSIHLGWRFQSTAGHFYGLILERLIEN